MTQKISLDNTGANFGSQLNVSLLGFKMAVNDSITVFNLKDGVVDEFHDETGNDESESSNDTYCSSNDNYVNNVPAAVTAGFTTTTITEPDTSAAGTNPMYYRTGPIPSNQAQCEAKRTGSPSTFGTYTVPTGMTSAEIKVWGAAGGTTDSPCSQGGGGGYVEGTLAVTASQVLYVSAGQGGYASNDPAIPSVSNNGGYISFFGGGEGGGGVGSGGGGAAGLFTVTDNNLNAAPEAYIVAGAGGGGGGKGGAQEPINSYSSSGGAGGGLVGCAGSGGGEQVSKNVYSGGGGDQEQGGAGGAMNEPATPSAPQADARGGNSPSPSIPEGYRGGGLFFGGEGNNYAGGGGGGD